MNEHINASAETKVEHQTLYYQVDIVPERNLDLIFQVKKVSSRQTNRKFIGRIVHQQLHIN